MMSATSSTRRRLTPFALMTGVAGSVLLASSMNGSLAAFTASITNTTNTAGSGTVVMQETNSDGSVICNSTDVVGVSSNAATCATINKYGGNLAMVPNQTVSTSINIKNTGTAPAATFTLTPGTCAQSTNGTTNGNALDFCKKVNVKITVGAAVVYTGNAFLLTAAIPLAAPVAPGATVAIKFDVTLDTTADNTYQGLKASQPLTWTFSS